MSDLQDIIENTKGLLDDVSENTIKGKFGLQKQQFIGKNINSLLNVLDNVNTAVELFASTNCVKRFITFYTFFLSSYS